jgi:type I restriction enzyme S subunit
MNHWPMVSLGEVLTHYKDYIDSPEPKTYPKLSVKLYGKGVELDAPTDGTGLKMKRHQLAKAGQVILSEIWGKKGAIGFVPQLGEGALCTSHFFLFDVVKERLLPKWLEYVFRANYLEKQLVSEAKGTTGYAAVRPAHLFKATIPLPPLPEQRRLVERIDALAAKIEEAKALRHAGIAAAISLWDRALIEAFTEIERNSKAKRFGEVCRVVRGGSPRPAGSPIFYDGLIPFLKVGDLTRDERKTVDTYMSTIKEAGRARTRWVEPGTLMLTNSGATLGIPKICSFGTTFNDGIQAFLGLPHELNREFLYYFLRSKTSWFRDWAARGQGQPNLNTEMVKQMTFPFLDQNSQARVVAYFDRLRSRLDGLVEQQLKAATELDAMLPAILDRAFRGEL